MTTRTIWGNRNQAIHNDASIPSLQVWEFARRALLDFNNAGTQTILIPPDLNINGQPLLQIYLRVMLMEQPRQMEGTLVLE